MMQNRFAKVLMTFCALMFLSFLLILRQEKVQQYNDSHNLGISLVRPAFAQDDEASFLEQEAGIAAYTNLGRNIDIAGIKATFKTVEKETDTYIVGSIPALGYEGYGKEDVHCFVHRDGWVVAYYLKDEPAAKVVNWQKLSSSKLNIVLTMVSNNAGASLPYVRYYHFKYPNATKLMIIGKTQPNSFRIMIPDSFIVYERSWSTTGNSGRYVEIDGTSVSNEESESGEYGTYGFATPVQLIMNEFHTVKPTSGSCAIVLVYGEF